MIQLSKLFTDKGTQKRNFYELCRKFQDNTLDKEILSLLELNKSKHYFHKNREDILVTVQAVLDKLQLEKDLIELLSTLRNKVFAHTDPNGPEYLLTIEQLETLKNLANEIYDLIFGKLWEPFYPNITSKFDFHKMIDLFNSRFEPSSNIGS
jgi:hypothetical protein